MIKMKGKVKGRLILSVILAGMVIFSCTKEEEMPPTNNTKKDTLTIKFTAFTAGDSMEFRKDFIDPVNRMLRVEKFLHYVSNIYLIKGSKEELIEDVALITYEHNGDAFVNDDLRVLKIPVKVGEYDGIKLSLGVDANQNASDPLTYPPGHPLSKDQDVNLYWGTWAMYRFAMIDGKIDTDGDNAVDLTYGIHPGLNSSYRTRTYNTPISVTEGGENLLDFTLEFNEIFFGNDTLDIEQNPLWHGDSATSEISEVLMSNMMDALTLE